MFKLKACMEMKSWISLSYTQIWLLALDQQQGSTGNEQEVGVWLALPSDLFKEESFLPVPGRYFGTCCGWWRGFSPFLYAKTMTQWAAEWHSSEGIVANSNPSLEVWGEPIQSLVSTWASTWQWIAQRRAIWARTAGWIFHQAMSCCRRT